MANRSSTAAFQAEIIKEQNQPIHLVEIHFDSPTGVQYLTDAFIPVTYSSNTYQPLGYFLSFSNIEETTDLQVSSLNLNLTGIDQVYIRHVLEETFIDRKVVIRKGFLNTTDDSLIANPIIVYQGNMNTPSITESGDMSTVSIEVANQFVDFSKTPGRFTNSESQNQFYPNDKGFQYAPQIIKDIVWGREFDPGTRSGGGDTDTGGGGTIIPDIDIGLGNEISILITGMNFTINPSGDVVVNSMANNYQVGYSVEVTGAIGDYAQFIDGIHIITASTADSFTFATSASPGSIITYQGGAEVTVDDEPIAPGVVTTVDTNIIDIPLNEPEVFTVDGWITIEEIEDVGGIDETNINEVDHGFITGDTVVIAGSTAVGGVPAVEINTTHTVGAIDKDSFQVAVTTDPTSTVTHGGGTSVTIDSNVPKPPPISTTSGSATVTNYLSDHGLIVGDKIKLSAMAEVGGLPLNLINTKHTIASVPDANSFTFTVSQDATATENGGGVLGTINTPVKATSTALGGGNKTKIKYKFDESLMKSSNT